MYRTAIIQPGQPTTFKICADGGELRSAVYDLIRSQGSVIGDDDHAGLIHLIGNARSMADIHGFAALKFGAASITMRPCNADGERLD